MNFLIGCAPVPRKRPIDEEKQFEVGGRVHRGVGRPSAAESQDPRLPMTIGHTDDNAAENLKPSTNEARSAQRTFSAYARNLVTEGGNVPRALALTLGRAPDYAWTDAEMVREHDRIRAQSRAFSTVSEIIELNDAGLAVRVAVLTDLMHSPVPAARIAAVRELTEIDETAKATRIGGTWEDLVRTVRAKAALALAKA